MSEHERKPRCYIAGPIAGIPDFRNRFAAAVLIVEAMGYEAVNPCDIVPATHEGDCPPGYDPGGDAGEHTSSACFMRSDLRALLDCDAIYMLTGWRESRGATAEFLAAVACGIPVIEKLHATPADELHTAATKLHDLAVRAVLPNPNDVPCADCGHSGTGRRHEYDHHLGYEAEHHESVEAVCSRCHHAREAGRRAE